MGFWGNVIVNNMKKADIIIYHAANLDSMCQGVTGYMREIPWYNYKFFILFHSS